MIDENEYTFPSQKSMSKYPLIKINGNPNDFSKWINAHPEIDNRVPPIYQNFRIEFTASEEFPCSIFVHYNDNLTAFLCKIRFNGENFATVKSDYENYTSEFEVNAAVPQRIADKYVNTWINEFLTAAVTIILAVQAYMLYFKPEIVEQIYAPAESKLRKTTTKKRRVNAEPIKIRQTKIKRIVLNANDRPPKNIDYKKLSWHVRGHYRHVGKEKKLRYIQPFVCNRGGKKYHKSAPTYIVEQNNDIKS